MEAVLREMVGDTVHEELAVFFDRKRRSKSRLEFLPVV